MIMMRRFYFLGVFAFEVLSLIQIFPLDQYAKHSKQIALHFSCVESNMFQTNCACHIRCTDLECQNAFRVCQKYQQSDGCAYVLTRGGSKNKIATLKRIPTKEEMQRLNIDEFYPEFVGVKHREARFGHGMNISNLVTDLADLGKDIIDALTFKSLNYSHPLCSAEKARALARPKKKHAAIRYLPPAVHSPSPSNISSETLSAHSLKNEWNTFQSQGIALVVLSYRSPYTLANSMRSWSASGLLRMMNETVALLSDPLPVEVSYDLSQISASSTIPGLSDTEFSVTIASRFGFKVLQPKDIEGAKTVKRNVLTIGAAFYYALQHVSSEYVLFLENDFKIDISLPRANIAGCGTFKTCNHGGIHLAAPSSQDRMRNWFAFYCRGRAGTESLVGDCLGDPAPPYRCFTSWDSNWSLNAAMVKKSTMLTAKYETNEGPKTIADIGLSHYGAQDGFETDMVYGVNWMRWNVPICISYNGMFIHEEIETRS